MAHWLNAILLVGMIASGLQIYRAFPHFGPRGEPYYSRTRWTAAASRTGRGSAAGWPAGSTGTSPWPGRSSSPGCVYLGFLAGLGRVARRCCSGPATSARRWQMQLYYLRLRREHPPQGKHNALQKGAYTVIVLLGALSVLTGFAIYKPVQLAWLTALFGGYELARYWHFWAVWIFVAFTLVHVALVFLVDPASLRAMITGWYRGRFPSHG